MWAQILCYKNQGIHWYHCNPTFLCQINFRLVRMLISALIWDISGLWNCSDGRDYREKRIAISRFLAPYKKLFVPEGSFETYHTFNKSPYYRKNKDFVSPRFRRRYLSNSQKKKLQIPCTSFKCCVICTYFMEKIEL